ncbi:WD40/YVTN/BNR-like repeat-containing protein [Haladaptatus sp. CMSO5]|uniref:WD40/YVTN/BNR-like repeat-containing protein n=1 Tax=Haladaptatus sp. CMSO5 TaxID=3120514 RepID=UPI002FCE3EAA
MTAIYAPLREVLVVATGQGEDWQTTERLDGHSIECVAVSQAAPDRVFVGTFDAGVQRSLDAGDTWEQVGEDVIEGAVMSARVSPHDPDTVYAGTEPSAVYRSTDGGDSWTALSPLTDLPSADEWYFPPRPDTHHVRWIEVDPADPDRLYVGIEAGAFVYSEDGGESWHERPSGSRYDNHSLAVHPDAPGRVYAAAGDGYAESRDGGKSWNHLQDGLRHRYCWSVAPDPGDPDTVVLTAASGPYSAHNPSSAESFIYRREGDGAWERCGADLGEGDGLVRAELATVGKPGVVYAFSNLGISRSSDAGKSWDSLSVPWSDRYTGLTPRGFAVIE